MSLRPAPFAPGLPPAGSSSAFIGRDAHGNVYLLRWHETNGWEALGWVGAGRAAMPALRHPAGQDQGLIVGHVEIAHPTPARAAERIEAATIGTKAPAVMGGWWCKLELGWKWNGPNGNGGTFPRPGGDWTGHLIPPEPIQRLRQRLEQRMQSAVVDAERMDVATEDLLAEATLGVRFADLAALLSAQEMHGPFGHLVGAVGLDESHWRIEDNPCAEPGYFSLPIFTQIDPFAAMRKAEGGQ